MAGGWLRVACGNPRCRLVCDYDGIDLVDHPVGGFDIGGGHLSIAEFDLAASDLDSDFLAVEGFHRAGFDTGCHDFSRDHVVFEDCGEFRFVRRFKQVLKGTRRQLGEGCVIGCEDREGPRTLQRFNKIGGGQGLDQGAEVRVPRGDLHDGGAVGCWFGWHLRDE